MSSGFYTDAPVNLTSSSDVLGRLDFVGDIKDRILGTITPDRSFAIGIIGQWGAGKTTFLNALENALSGEESVIQLRFNPWITKSPEGITALFFSDLATRLARYDDGLRKDVLSYSKDLVHAVDNNGLSLVKTLFSLTAQENDLQEKHKVINDSIRRLNRKLIIYIDDVDRLEKSEVVEVLRIIRNTADFGNTFFVVAFDRVYATSSINEALVSGTTSYLEKIFQLEYYLPLHPNRKVFVSTLFTELSKIVDEKGRTVLAKIESPDDNFFNLEVVPPLSSYIHSFRDVNRYMNVFLLNYDRIKNNIYLPDFLSVCLLRLKFPEIYQLLYFEKYRFLTTDQEQGIFEQESGILAIRFPSKQERTVEQTLLYLELEKNPTKYAITTEKVLEAAKLVFDIFAPDNKTDIGTYRRTLPNHHLTITDASCFDRYFDFSMQGRLDQAAFEAALHQPIEKIERTIEEWNQSRSLSTDLQIKLENLQAFESRNDFEKIITAIVHYANQPAPGNLDYPNSFNTDTFYAKLGGNDTPQNQVIHTLYGGDREAFRHFFKSLYNQNIQAGKWDFMLEFVSKLIKEERDNFALSLEELKDLVRDSFIEAIAGSDNLTRDIMQFYNHAVRLFQKPSSGHGHLIPVDRGREMTVKLIELIRKDVQGFLSWNIYPEPPRGEYQLNKWHLVVFETEEAFEKLLQEYSGDPYVEEYRQFQEAYKTHGPIPYSFEHLDVI